MGLTTNEIIHYALETAAFAGVAYWIASTNSKLNGQIQELKTVITSKDQKIKELEDRVNILTTVVNAHSAILRNITGINVPGMAPQPQPNNIGLFPSFPQTPLTTQKDYPNIPEAEPQPKIEVVEQVESVTEEESYETLDSEGCTPTYDTEELDSILSEELKDLNSKSNSLEEEDKKNG